MSGSSDLQSTSEVNRSVWEISGVALIVFVLLLGFVFLPVLGVFVMAPLEMVITIILTAMVSFGISVVLIKGLPLVVGLIRMLWGYVLARDHFQRAGPTQPRKPNTLASHQALIGFLLMMGITTILWILYDPITPVLGSLPPSQRDFSVGDVIYEVIMFLLFVGLVIAENR